MVVLKMDTQLVEDDFDTHVPASRTVEMIISHRHVCLYTRTLPMTLRYMTSKSKDKHLPVEGVVPFDQPLNKFNVKKEMRLPAICDSLRTPSAANPNKYMLRKRMSPAPHPQMGICYPESPDPVKLPEFRPKKHQAEISMQ
jgi:hypothetical protein